MPGRTKNNVDINNINEKTIKVGTHNEFMENNNFYKEIIEVSNNKILEDEDV